MQKKAKNLIKISAIYVGTVLGAGFASGQELMLFFVRFYRRGLLGCLLAGGLFCLLGQQILKRSFHLKERTHRAFLTEVFGKRAATFLGFVTEVFLSISFCVMLSGSGAFFAERLSVSPVIGILLTDVLCLFVFLYDLKGLSLLNVIFSPLMLLGTVAVAVYAIWMGTVPAFLPPVNRHALFLPYALFYVGYNMLTATAVLVPTAGLAEDEKTAGRGGLLGGALLTGMVFLCCLALFFTESVWSSELPMLLLSEQAGAVAYGIYSVVLFMAMLTTAVSTGFSVIQSLGNAGVKKRPAACLVCLISVPLSFIEFSVLVKSCYVFFGILGIWLVAGILYDLHRKS